MKLWLKRIFAILLFVLAIVIALSELISIESAPTLYQGPGAYSEEERYAIQAASALGFAAIAFLVNVFLVFLGLLLLSARPTVRRNSTHPRWARAFYYAFSSYLQRKKCYRRRSFM